MVETQYSSLFPLNKLIFFTTYIVITCWNIHFSYFFGIKENFPRDRYVPTTFLFSIRIDHYIYILDYFNQIQNEGKNKRQ